MYCTTAGIVGCAGEVLFLVVLCTRVLFYFLVVGYKGYWKIGINDGGTIGEW